MVAVAEGGSHVAVFKNANITIFFVFPMFYRHFNMFFISQPFSGLKTEHYSTEIEQNIPPLWVVSLIIIETSHRGVSTVSAEG